MQTFYIKNMVCDRCKAAVKAAFLRAGATPISVELGTVNTADTPSCEQRAQITAELEAQGFELLQDNRTQTVERIKALIIELLRYTGDRAAQNRNVSEFLADRLHSDYSALSKLFSAETGNTIEKYVIMQKVERVKELLCYGELSLTEIARTLNYSSVAYLSSQFKNVTGMTPSQYKSSDTKNRKELDRI